MGAVPHDGRPDEERAAEGPSGTTDGVPLPDAPGSGAPGGSASGGSASRSGLNGFPVPGGEIYSGSTAHLSLAGDPPQASTEVPATPIGLPREGHRHRWGLGAFALAVGVFLAASYLVGALIDTDSPSVLELGIVLAVPGLLAAGVALVATWLRGNGPSRDLALGWAWRDIGTGLIFGLGGLFVGLVASAVWVSFVGPNVSSAVAEAFAGRRASVPAALLIAILAVVVAPVCEEILFRGLLWGALEKLGAGRWVTFAVTTLLFVLFHFEYERTPLLLVIAVPIGLARAVTGSLLASVMAHQVNNLPAGVVLYLTLTGTLTL